MVLPKLELIAVHIKKTAGMSFRHLLLEEYGRENYYRMNINGKSDMRVEAFNKHMKRVPENTRVIQGHFRYSDALPLYEAKPDVPVVTWLRNPVKRVISKYYFSKRKYLEGLREGKDFWGKLSLVEYARRENSQNEMSGILEGCDLADLAFVGILEHIEDDVADLAAMLGWKPYSIPARNTNDAFKAKFPPPTEEEKEEIARLNQADMDLYQYALELREQRKAVEISG